MDYLAAAKRALQLFVSTCCSASVHAEDEQGCALVRVHTPCMEHFLVLDGDAVTRAGDTEEGIKDINVRRRFNVGAYGSRDSNREREEQSLSGALLYDIGGHLLPQRGEFRSLQVFACWVCGARSNLVSVGGYPGHSVSVVCPNATDCSHHVLEIKVHQLSWPHEGKDALQADVDRMRQWFASIHRDDVLGEADLSQERTVTITFRRTPGFPCSHGNARTDV